MRGRFWLKRVFLSHSRHKLILKQNSNYIYVWAQPIIWHCNKILVKRNPLNFIVGLVLPYKARYSLYGIVVRTDFFVREILLFFWNIWIVMNFWLFYFICSSRHEFLISLILTIFIERVCFARFPRNNLKSTKQKSRAVQNIITFQVGFL